MNRIRVCRWQRLSCIVLGAGLWLTATAAFSRTPRATAPDPGASHAQFEALPLERSPQNHLIVRAFINGKPALLGVDTGAPVSAIAANRRQYYGLTLIAGTSKLPPKLMINGAFSAVGMAKSLRI